MYDNYGSEIITILNKKRFVKQWIDGKYKEKPIIIYGKHGVGKTFLSEYILKDFITIKIDIESCKKIPSLEDYLKLSLYNQLFTRIGNNDNLFRGQSTFYREMLELDTILRNSDKNTLVIADELCSGSEQMSAQAILATTIESLSKRFTSNLITTHFHGCLSLSEITELDMVKFYHFKVEYEDGTLIYNRNLEDGVGPKLYGIEVSRHILGEGNFIDRCLEIRNKLQGMGDTIKDDVKKSKYNSELKVTKCEVCGKVAEYDGELHTHHISEQADADDYGNIDHISKNSKGNLVVLCKKHHEMVHHGGLSITGWKQSVTRGLYLDHVFTKNIKPTSHKKKYSEMDIKNVLSLNDKRLKPKAAKQWLETNGGFKCISEITIRKIWKGTY